jgi:hypothetical protein
MAKANRKLSRFAKRHYEAIAEAMQEARAHLRCDAVTSTNVLSACLRICSPPITLNSNVSVSLMRASPARM